jgi:hypothetical protein
MLVLPASTTSLESLGRRLISLHARAAHRGSSFSFISGLQITRVWLQRRLASRKALSTRASCVKLDGLSLATFSTTLSRSSGQSKSNALLLRRPSPLRRGSDCRGPTCGKTRGVLLRCAAVYDEVPGKLSRLLCFFSDVWQKHRWSIRDGLATRRRHLTLISQCL